MTNGQYRADVRNTHLQLNPRAPPGGERRRRCTRGRIGRIGVALRWRGRCHGDHHFRREHCEPVADLLRQRGNPPGLVVEPHVDQDCDPPHRCEGARERGSDGDRGKHGRVGQKVRRDGRAAVDGARLRIEEAVPGSPRFLKTGFRGGLIPGVSRSLRVARGRTESAAGTQCSSPPSNTTVLPRRGWLTNSEAPATGGT